MWPIVFPCSVISSDSEISMAKHADNRLHDRAHTDDGWQSRLPEASMFESILGQISYPQSHGLSTETYSSRPQDTDGRATSAVSNNLNLPMPTRIYHPIRWPQKSTGDNYKLSPIDSGFGSGLELEARYSAANNSFTEAFKHQPELGRIEPSTTDLRSPTSGFWPLYLPSRCTDGFS